MQSKTAFVLLGLLKEKPMNPYEIIKILEKLNISQWSPISSSAVYATIHVLEKKGYITGERFKTSAMPEKTVYSITPIGEKEFIKALIDYLKNDIKDITRFNLSTLFICHLQKEKIMYILNERLENILINIEATEQAYLMYQKNLVPEYKLISLVHNVNFYKAELDLVKIMLGEIAKTDQWNHYLTMDF